MQRWSFILKYLLNFNELPSAGKFMKFFATVRSEFCCGKAYKMIHLMIEDKFIHKKLGIYEQLDMHFMIN